jgi:hypothetical protein
MEDINTSTRTDISRDKNLSESRFKIVWFFIRFAGIPVNAKSVSVLTVIYNITVIVCCYTTTAFLQIDVFVHRHQFVDVMKKIRVLFIVYLSIWIHASLR